MELKFYDKPMVYVNSYEKFQLDGGENLISYAVCMNSKYDFVMAIQSLGNPVKLSVYVFVVVV